MQSSKRLDYNVMQRAYERRLLEKIARGEAAARVLGLLCESVEQLFGRRARCAVHLADAEGVRMVKVIAAAGEDYFEQRDPVPISLTGGTSTAAAYLRRQLVADGIESDQLVSGGSGAAAREHAAGTVCATPVMSADAALLAVFSVYYAQLGVPQQEDMQAIEWATWIVRIVLGHERTVSCLSRSEEKYRTFLENLRDGVFIAQEGIVVYANPAMAVLTGRAGSDLLGSDFYAMADAGDAARLRGREASRVRGERVPGEYALRIVRADGEMRTMRLNQAAITWNDAPAWLATLTDITERERAQLEVRRLNAELEQRVQERTRELVAVNRELEAFSYSVSHDLRAPLRSIKGFCAILMREHAAALGDKARGPLERVMRAAQRMGEMIEGLLALARVGREAPRVEAVDLGAMTRDIVMQLRETQPARAVEFDIADNAVARGDRRLLRAVLDNLLSNAWKFTGKVERARIAFGACERGGERIFFVADNGAGFDMQYAEKLFGVFQRLHRTEDFEGTGVGLATVQRIIACHGGRIWAEAQAGRGAAFYFTLA